MTWFPKLTEAPLKKVGTILKQDATEQQKHPTVEAHDPSDKDAEEPSSEKKKDSDSLLDLYV